MCESILRNSSLDNNETILRNSHHLSVELPSPPIRHRVIQVANSRRDKTGADCLSEYYRL